MSELQEQIEEAAARDSNLLTEILTIESEVEELGKGQEATAHEIARLEMQLEESIVGIKAFEQEVKSAGEGDPADLESFEKRASDAQANLSSGRQKGESFIEELKTQQAEAKSKMEKAKANIGQQEKGFVKAQALSKDNHEREGAVNQWTANVQHAESAFRDAETVLNDIDSKLASAEEDFARRLMAAEQAVATVSCELEHAKSAVQQRQEALTSAEQKLNVALADKEELEENLLKKREEADICAKFIASSKSRIEGLQQERINISEQLQEMRSELEELRENSRHEEEEARRGDYARSDDSSPDNVSRGREPKKPNMIVAWLASHRQGLAWVSVALVLVALVKWGPSAADRYLHPEVVLSDQSSETLASVTGEPVVGELPSVDQTQVLEALRLAMANQEKLLRVRARNQELFDEIRQGKDVFAPIRIHPVITETYYDPNGGFATNRIRLDEQGVFYAETMSIAGIEPNLERQTLASLFGQTVRFPKDDSMGYARGPVVENPYSAGTSEIASELRYQVDVNTDAFGELSCRIDGVEERIGGLEKGQTAILRLLEPPEAN